MVRPAQLPLLCMVESNRPIRLNHTQ